MTNKQPNPNYIPPASTGCKTPEYRRMTEAPEPKPAERASEYITISVAEYHFLTKAATLLEGIMHLPVYADLRIHIEAARKCIYFSEAGAEE